MSGIAGIYWLDGRPAGSSEIEGMVDAMAHRGPDGLSTWHEGALALGHAMLQTTPESLHETQPLVHRRGDLVLTADARIDNRDDLIRALRPPRPDGRPITDAELILAAYEKWGADCPKHLLGAFAFALWDAREHRLFCARDHFGVKPFYYHYAPGRCFVFASELRGVLACEGVPRSINERRIADYLAFVEDNASYTFFDDIHRLLPAHTVVVQDTSLDRQLYWSLSFPEQPSDRTLEHNASSFRALFLDAVHRRIRSATPVASLLSGGLDSSAILGVAHQATRLLDQTGGGLHAVSGRSEGLPEADEAQYIDAMLNVYPVSSWEAEVSDVRPVHDIKRLVELHGEPPEGHLFNIVWRLSPLIRDRGFRVTLDGHGGDEVVGHGRYYLRQLAREGAWIRVLRELQGTPVEQIQAFVRITLTYGSLPTVWAERLQRAFNTVLNVSKPGRVWWTQLVQPSFMQEMGTVERWQRRQRAAAQCPTERHRHHETLTLPLQASAFEEIDRTAAHGQTEQRFPFWDRRLVELCVTLPTEQRRRHGTGRRILREAMKGILPELIRRRRDKAYFTKIVGRAMQRHIEPIRSLAKANMQHVDSFIRPKRFMELVQRFGKEGEEASATMIQPINRILFLGHWMAKGNP
ncbi:MAG: asparagine synthase (glutamine-hydrolyzing) [Bacteroidetes bacterium]|jgi:asparagine synthase (glutamine-hydrolysing)|nr:asparagine synthase (glutamine-hydrolyzing) [Bacteroidota bacterium]